MHSGSCSFQPMSISLVSCRLYQIKFSYMAARNLEVINFAALCLSLAAVSELARKTNTECLEGGDSIGKLFTHSKHIRRICLQE